MASQSPSEVLSHQPHKQPCLHHKLVTTGRSWALYGGLVPLCFLLVDIPALHRAQSFLLHTTNARSILPVQVSRVRLFATPWTAAHQASLSITISRSFLKLMSIELVMPSNRLILCRLLLLLTLIFPSLRVFSNESILCIRWSKHWDFSFSISLPNGHSGLISQECSN